MSKRIGDSRTELVVPVAEEEISVGVATTEAYRVRVRKTVERDELVIDAPHARDDISVDRVPMNLETDVPPKVRTEGNTTIIPVVEEIVVFRKRFVVREEIRITKTRVEETRPIHVTRLREHAEVAQIEAREQRSPEERSSPQGTSDNEKRRRTS